MELIPIISVVLTSVSLLGVLIGFIIRVTSKNAKLELAVENLTNQMKTKAEQLEKQIILNDENNKRKFDDYYKFKNETSITLAKIETNTSNMESLLKEIKNKLEEKE